MIDVLADETYGHLVFGVFHCLDNPIPVGEVHCRQVQPEMPGDDIIEALLAQFTRQLVDVVDIDSRNYRILGDIGKQRDLAAFVGRDLAIRPIPSPSAGSAWS